MIRTECCILMYGQVLMCVQNLKQYAKQLQEKYRSDKIKKYCILYYFGRNSNTYILGGLLYA